MKISVDSAALCDRTNRYGNYIFTMNVIEAIKRIDKKNEYTLYSFCRKPTDLALYANQKYKRILPKKFWLSARVGWEELLNPQDIFLALNQAVPFLAKSRIFSFSHGLSFYFFKDLYLDAYEQLKGQLFTMIDKSEHIFVSSKKVKEEIDAVFLKQKKVRVLTYGIPYDMLTLSYDPQEISPRVKEIKTKYFLYVGMNHPIKNIQFLIDAFKIFSQSRKSEKYRLLLVGGDFEVFKEQGENIENFRNINRSELKFLFQRADGYLTTSLYESFNLPVLEALSQGCPVVARSTAVIPELKRHVYIADHVEEFVESMKLFASGKARKTSRERLKIEFSWDDYLTNLLSFYSKTP